MRYHFSNEQLSDFQSNIKKEWVMTNGLGGYCGTSVLGALGRTHQGYLIASLHPPVERYVVFSKTAESVFQDNIRYELESAQHAGAPIADSSIASSDVPDAYKQEDTVSVASDFQIRRPVYTEGQRYLESFDYDGTVSFCYHAGNVSMTKRLALIHGQNACVISYDIRNTGSEAVLTITPHMNFREHSTPATVDSLSFKTEVQKGYFALTPAADPSVQIRLHYSCGELLARQQLYDEDVQLQTEVELETPGLDTHYTPYDLHICVPAGQTMRVSVICEVVTEQSLFPEGIQTNTASEYVAAERNRLLELIAQSGLKDSFAQSLVVSSSHFLCRRQSTGLTTVLAGLPWFTDWGRDTMIAFTGLTLATRRFDEAREILLTFAKYIHHGLVPNMFPDDGQPPLYNTADASLWYFYAVHQYLNYCDTPEAWEFIRTDIYPALKQIISAYMEGTDFSIYMDTDGLIHAGSGNDQVTWMDVRVGDWVVTPRHGKPVEINALWYNALKVMEGLAARFHEDSHTYCELAKKVCSSFGQKFWNSKDNCLYDVIDGETKDADIRPNQIYAVSLPYTMLSPEQQRAVVDTVSRSLYVGCGLRSLSPDNREYHPVYCGSLPKRDAAYHQGTAWGYLLGGYITAYLKVYGHTPDSVAKADRLLDPIRKHLWEGCIGSISEIFDGDAPHTCRGCYAQAWSVGEILRCYTEDILPHQV